MPNHPAAALTLRPGDRAELVRLTRSPSVRPRLSRRAQIVLLAADGQSNTAIADLTGISRRTVIRWRERYRARGMAELADQPRTGRPRKVDHRRIVAATLQPPPQKYKVTQWSSRLLAQHLKIGDATVARAWRQYGVQPWAAESFQFSTDPGLVAKVTDVAGLYLAPPENAVVLCVDETSQIQAPDRAAPVRPAQPCPPGRRARDDTRHGTSTLSAALELAAAQVTAAYEPWNHHQKFLAFLRRAARAYPDRELHLVMDNYAAHKHAGVQSWLAANPRIKVHCTSTHASWMNLVAIWLAITDQQAIHRGSVASAEDLNVKICAFITGWNDHAYPFTWTRTASPRRRRSQAASENRQALVFRYAIKGPVPEAVLMEIHRAHIGRNMITECYRAADEEIARLYAAVPAVAAAAAAAEAAGRHLAKVQENIQARQRRGRAAQPSSELAGRLTAAREQAAAARAALKEARAAVRAGLRAEETRIREASQARVKGLRSESASGRLYAGTAAPGALYWAAWDMVLNQQRVALNRVIARRQEGRSAELRFRRWDGSGMTGLHLRRKAGDPDRSPPALAGRSTGKWRNVVLLTPLRTEAEWATLPPAARKRAELRIRIGSHDSASWQTLPIVLHRPLPADADVVAVRVSVQRITSTRVRASGTLTVRLPAPELRTEGPVVAIHTGWRVLPDGAIRVAVVAGAAAPPAGIGQAKDVARARVRQQARRTGTRSAVPGRPWAGDTPSAPESGVRDHGTWQEIVIPPGRRQLEASGRTLGAIRDRAMNQVRSQIAAHLTRHPIDKDVIDPDGSLGRWRSPRQFRRALRALEDTGEADPALVKALHQWQEQDIHLELRQAYQSRRHLRGWRQDLYRQVGAWLASEARVIVVDPWPAGQTIVAGDDDTPQRHAARANAVLAAPGELRRSVTEAAGRRGVTVHPGPVPVAGIHYSCGGELPAEERRQQVTVTCRACGRQVDQDRNVLEAMLAAAAVVR